MNFLILHNGSVLYHWVNPNEHRKSPRITDFSLGQFYNICILPLECRMRTGKNSGITVKYTYVIFTGTFLILKGEHFLIKKNLTINIGKYNFSKIFWECFKDLNGATE